MSMVIQHNIPALQTYNIVNSTSNSLQKSIAKLSSGLRINSAADDAAGLAISEKMRSQVRGLDRAVANTQDGISLIQTAEGALSETHSILQRMRELSVQAANDTLTQQDRSYIQEEVEQLKDEITRVGNTTQFNKKKLINGESSALWSSNDLETKALIRGGLRDIDQFGQKKSVEGNYKIRVKADPGQAEVQKSDIMTIKHPNVIIDKTINTADGVKDVQVDNMTPGTYDMKLGGAAAAPSTATLTGEYGLNDSKDDWTMTTVTIGAFGDITATTDNLVEVDFSLDGGTNSLFKIALNADTDGTTAIDATADDAFAAFQAQADGLVKAAADNNVVIEGIDTLTVNGGKLTLKVKGSTPADLSATAAAGTPAPTVTTDTANATTGKLTAKDIFTVTSTADNELNGSLLFEVIGKDDDNKTVTLKATATTLSQDGKNATATMDNIVLKEGETNADLSELFGGKTGDNLVKIKLNMETFDLVDDNAKFVESVTAGKNTAGTNAISTSLKGTIDGNWDDAWDDGNEDHLPYGVFGGTVSTDAATGNETFTPNSVKYALDGSALKNTEVQFKNFILNEKTGTVTEGNVIMSTDNNFNYTSASTQATNEDTLAAFTTTYIGKTASGDVKLRDLDKFWNSEGKFMLDDAKTLTLNQGNGNTATITLYANDTLDDVATKINNAIATDLGQSKYVDDATKFATFVTNKGVNSEAVPGTFVIRSIVPGKQGEITFSGDQEVLDAFSLNTIQESKETKYSVDVLDEHSDKVIAQNVQTTDNVMYGVIHPNVDVEFSALSGVSATWNNNLNKFTYDSKMEETTLHIADNTTVLQIGANEGEDLAMDIGDMRSHALGLDGVNMMSHDRAARSITIIDNAIDRVSTQRAKLGAYQNRLEYTANNLTTASENLTSAESRIRDADMAKEMMNFTKLNIMLQAGNSMLAQANQQPQNVLSLIR